MAWNAFSMAEYDADRFFDAVGIIHHEFVPESTTVSSHHYLGVIERLYARMCHVRID
jgi:hypothetical protein